MAELREISSRARITSTSLTKTYSYGDFRGDPLELLTSYFDAHVYVANWGTHTLMLGFPKAAVDVRLLKQYVVDAVSDYDDGVSVQECGDRVLVRFSHSDADGGGWRGAAPTTARLVQPAASPSQAAGPARTVRDLVLAGRDRANELKRRRSENQRLGFSERLSGVRARHKAETSFIQRLDEAGLQ